MRGSPNFAAVFAALRSTSTTTKSAPPRPARAAALRSCDPAPARSSARIRLNDQTEVHMHVQTARTQAWLAELASIQAEITAHGMPAPALRPAGSRTRKLKPLWEE